MQRAINNNMNNCSQTTMTSPQHASSIISKITALRIQQLHSLCLFDPVLDPKAEISTTNTCYCFFFFLSCIRHPSKSNQAKPVTLQHFGTALLLPQLKISRQDSEQYFLNAHSSKNREHPSFETLAISLLSVSYGSCIVGSSRSAWSGFKVISPMNCLICHPMPCLSN